METVIAGNERSKPTGSGLRPFQRACKKNTDEIEQPVFNI
jgi:hypothetical protein